MNYKLVNCHIHTPYSFSAFSSIEQAVELAVKENVKVLGINDFNTMDGYAEFYKACIKERIYPLFNIEFMGLIKEYQSKNIRVNDPNNPGRIYFSGKGLRYPLEAGSWKLEIEKLQNESNRQTKQMIDKANAYFSANKIPITLNFDSIKGKYAKGMVRERHIAKAIRLEIGALVTNERQLKEFLTKLYNCKESKVDVNNNNALENELRNNLLKLGGPAFVPEDENAFLNINEIIEIIISAGGIPCYPVLLDDSKGNFTDFEKDWDKMDAELSGLNIGCIELIPGRNSLEILEKFVDFFYKRKYIITFGTEHNTPDLVPVSVSCRNNTPLSDELLKISYEGACVIAAHQYLKKFQVSGFKFQDIDGGYLDKNNVPKRKEIRKYIDFGRNVIDKMLV